jgi:hypothetical protein
MSSEKEEEYIADVKDPNLIKILDEYYVYDKKNRGEFLIRANRIEDFLEQIIAKLLIGEDKEKEEFIILILRKIGYDVKTTLFSNLMEKFLPEWDLNKTNTLSKLSQVKKIRNIYAHSSMDLSNKFLNSNSRDMVQFEVKKDGKIELKKFTKNELENYHQISGSLMNDLIKIDVHLHDKNKKSLDSKRSAKSLQR